MSCYEWEAGTIKIPSAEWAGTKASIREAVNKRHEALFLVAEASYKELIEKMPGFKAQVAAKTMSNHNIERKAYDIIDGQLETHARRSNRRVDQGDNYEIFNKIVVTHNPKTYKPITPKLRKPLKKDFPIHNGSVNHLDDGDCSVTFDNDTRSIRWDVPENNHAVDNAREGTLGKAFFGAMKKITWTRESGGQILGNDEYNRDAGRDYDGGGGTLTKATFGKEQQELEAKARQAYNPYGFRR